MYRIKDENGKVLGILFEEQCKGWNILDVLKNAEYELEHVVEEEDVF